MKNRPLLLPAVLAVGLWIAGLVVINTFSDKIPHHPTDAQLLTWIQGNQNPIMLRRLALDARLPLVPLVRGATAAAARGGRGRAAHLHDARVRGRARGDRVRLLIQAGDLGAAIDQDSISAATAGTLHHISDMFFVGAELALIPFFVGVAVVAFRTAVLPKWWAAFSILIAVVLVIGPIGWAALIFGTPVWLLGTGLIVGSKPRLRQRTVAAATA